MYSTALYKDIHRSVMVAACFFLLCCYCYHYYCIALWDIDAGIVFSFAYFNIFLEILYILYYWFDTVILDLIRKIKLFYTGGWRARSYFIRGVWGGPAPSGPEKEGRDPAWLTTRARAGPAATGWGWKSRPLQDQGKELTDSQSFVSRLLLGLTLSCSCPALLFAVQVLLWLIYGLPLYWKVVLQTNNETITSILICSCGLS